VSGGSVPSAGPVPVVEARGLVRRYGACAALDGVDLALGQGEFVLLLGPNGAGKSTLLRLVAMLQTPTAGSLRLWGSEPAGPGAAALRRRIGLLAHHGFLYDHLTAAENLAFYGRLYGLTMDAAGTRKALAEVGLETRRDDRVRTFSRGMQQRLALARTLLHRPEILLLDEPFTGLDRQGAGMLQAMLEAHLGQGRSGFLVTHDFVPALPLATRVVVLVDGRVALDRPAAGLDAAGLESLYRGATDGAPGPA
jgi:heme ABC exporter ATP-binding subunit CcmA